MTFPGRTWAGSQISGRVLSAAAACLGQRATCRTVLPECQLAEIGARKLEKIFRSATGPSMTLAGPSTTVTALLQSRQIFIVSGSARTGRLSLYSHYKNTESRHCALPCLFFPLARNAFGKNE